MDKKGKLDMKVLVAVFLTIIGIIIIATFTAGTMPAWQTASDNLRDDPCNDAGGFWNTTDDGQCQVSSTNDTLVTYTDYAMAGLFGRQSSVIVLAILAMVLLVSILAIFVFMRNR